MLRLKRVYDDPGPADGYRVLVDRLWPRGLSKEAAQINEWLKEVGPSNELRQWFGHDPAKFSQFASRYRNELQDNPAFGQLRRLAAQHPTLTLVYSAKDEEHNQAVVLKRLLEEQFGK